LAIFEKPPRYRTYLLTMWEERSQDPTLPSTWRFRLEDSRRGWRRGFADAESLVAALEGEMAQDLRDDREYREPD
jgi:hypothetical protein